MESQTKDIKDYLHLYLGCEAEVSNIPDGLAITDHPQIVTIDGTVVDCLLMMYSSIKPILRSLSSMTEEEAKEIAKMYFSTIPFKDKYFSLQKNGWYIRIKYHQATLVYGGTGYSDFTPEIFRHLLSKGFDLFNLILEGLAIDKDKLLNPL